MTMFKPEAYLVLASPSDEGFLILSQNGRNYRVPYTVISNLGSRLDDFEDGTFTADTISEETAGAGITLDNNLIRNNTATALNTTGTLTAAMIVKGLVTSTSAATVTATLDSVANIVAATGAVRGTVIDFMVDNSAGANTVTVAVPAGITAATPVVTGGNTLTVSVANGVGLFRLVFVSTSAARLYRIG